MHVLRTIQPETPVFTNIDGRPIEPNAFSKRWHAFLRALGLRPRGLYRLKDTFSSVALTAGVSIPWLESLTGVRYDTLRRHYGKWLWAEGPDQLTKIEQLAPELAPKSAGSM